MSASNPRFARLVTSAIVAAVSLSAGASPIAAQYFGRNQVQYTDFDFRIMRTQTFDIYYYPEAEVAVRDAARMAERWYTRLSRIFDHQFENRQPVVLYANHPHFQQTTTIRGAPGEGTGGVTESLKQRVILPLAGSYEQTDHVMGHELVHAFQYDISGLGRSGGNITSGAQAFGTAPLWFTEGMAEYLTIGPVDPHTAMWLRDAALTGRIPSIEQLTRDPRYFPYRWGQAFWAYVTGRWGDAVVGQILKMNGQGVPYDEAIERVLNTELDELSEDWQTSIRRAYLPLLTERREAREQARPLITRKGEGGRINLAPSVSPDGRQVAFLSELEFLDVELYVANAETGEVTRRLVRGTAFDPHFGSLRYINSAGTWSPDSRRFAFSALRKAQDVVVVLDVGRARILREYKIPGVGEITNPTWSPDGRTIVVSGQRGGISDLYALDVESGTVRQLTNDRFADLHPAYSPDGRTIAFVTDRGPDSDLNLLRYGSYKVALMDVGTQAIRIAPQMDKGRNNINPAWTRDGSGIFFVSERSGIPNIYRLTLATGGLTQVTNLFTGVSGITDLSPAISSSSGTDKVLFTAYERNEYNIYALTGPSQLAGTEPEAPKLAGGVPLPAVLPPIPRPPEVAYNRLSAALEDVATGLPSAQVAAAWPSTPYRPRLSLDYVGQPSVGVSTGGAYQRGGVSGGISGIFSDMLGYHTVFAQVQAQGQLDEIGFSTVYLNRRNRWNYGAAVQRVPYISGYRAASPDGSIQRLVIQRYFDSSLQGLLQYPFSRVQRAEFSAGLRRISSDFQVQEVNFNTGTQERRDLDGPSYNLGESSAALVYDNALSSYTSPFAGQRYRLEVSPTFGSIQFVQGIADYRRYLFFRPFTLAVRGYHFGRYGRDESALSSLFLGYPFLMRGYSASSVREGCAGGDTNDCEVFGSLFGSRVGVANAELRFPLFQQVVVGGSIGLPPIEGFAFFDAGSAWGESRDFDTRTASRSTPVFRRGLQINADERGILTSGGGGARVNLFGYVIVEAAYVKPFERNRGWHWQFSFQPGF